VKKKLIWLDNRINYDHQWLYKDSFIGLHNLRISILPSGQIQMSTWFYKSQVIYCSTGENASDALYRFLNSLHHTDILIVRHMYEWTLSEEFINSSLVFFEHVRSKAKCYVLKFLHICDTHHGLKPINSAISYCECLQPDIITCNQLHHLHFFDSMKVLLNIPRTSLDNTHHYTRLSQSKVPNPLQHIYFPATVNNVHLRRQKYYNLLSNSPSLSKFISNQRFDVYRDWLYHLFSSLAFIYVPLSNSIGLNNIIPASIVRKRIFAFKLPKYTGQQYIYDKLFCNTYYFTTYNELYDLACATVGEKRIHGQDYPNSVQTAIYSSLLPTPRTYVDALVNDTHTLLDQFPVSKIDSRYNQLTTQRHVLPRKTLIHLISLYEDIQNLCEYFLDLNVFLPSKCTEVFTPEALKYLYILLQDLPLTGLFSHGTYINNSDLNTSINLLLICPHSETIISILSKLISNNNPFYVLEPSNSITPISFKLSRISNLKIESIPAHNLTNRLLKCSY